MCSMRPSSWTVHLLENSMAQLVVALRTHTTSTPTFLSHGQARAHAARRASPIYHVDNLPLKSHTLQILNRITNQQFHDSDLLIDYAVIDDGTPQSTTVTGTGATASSTSAEQTQTAVPSHSSFPVAAVVVPIVLVLLLAAGVGFWLSRRRRRNRPVNGAFRPSCARASILMITRHARGHTLPRGRYRKTIRLDGCRSVTPSHTSRYACKHSCSCTRIIL